MRFDEARGCGPVYVEHWPHGYVWTVVHLGCRVAGGSKSDLESAKAAADLAALEWYRLPAAAKGDE